MDHETQNLIVRYRMALKAIEDAINNGFDKRAMMTRAREIEAEQYTSTAPDGTPEIVAVGGSRVAVR